MNAQSKSFIIKRHCCFLQDLAEEVRDFWSDDVLYLGHWHADNIRDLLGVLNLSVELLVVLNHSYLFPRTVLYLEFLDNGVSKKRQEMLWDNGCCMKVVDSISDRTALIKCQNHIEPVEGAIYEICLLFRAEVPLTRRDSLGTDTFKQAWLLKKKIEILVTLKYLSNHIEELGAGGFHVSVAYRLDGGNPDDI